MSWNYRILAHETNNGNYFEIYEVYYDKNNKPNGYTSEPISAGGNDLKEISDQLKRMATALEKPILYAGEKFPQEFPESKTDIVDEEQIVKEINRLQEKYDEDGCDVTPLIKLQRIEQLFDYNIKQIKNKHVAPVDEDELWDEVDNIFDKNTAPTGGGYEADYTDKRQFIKKLKSKFSITRKQ